MKNKSRLFSISLLAGLTAWSVGCGGGADSNLGSTGATLSKRNYNATASVGDFMTITLDPNTHTIAYQNLTNGDSATATYTVNSDGTYAINDPKGNLVAGVEVPGTGLVLQATKSGPTHDVLSLVTAVQSEAITVAGLANHRYNYIQFRTNSGGVEIGDIAFDGASNGTHEHFWPYGDQSGGTPFGTGNLPTAGLVAGPNNAYLSFTQNNSTDTVFGTAAGFFAVDNSNGAIVSMGQAANKAFDPTTAGTYHALVYSKTNATTGQGNVEVGTPAMGMRTVNIAANGGITVSDANQNVLVSGTLAPVADQAYLVGQGKLSDPCFGYFTVRTTTGTSREDVFVTFLNGALILADYSTALPLVGGNPYSYFYGVGLK